MVRKVHLDIFTKPLPAVYHDDPACVKKNNDHKRLLFTSAIYLRYNGLEDIPHDRCGGMTGGRI